MEIIWLIYLTGMLPAFVVGYLIEADEGGGSYKIKDGSPVLSGMFLAASWPMIAIVAVPILAITWFWVAFKRDGF